MLKVSSRMESNLPSFKSGEKTNTVDTNKKTHAGLKTGAVAAGLQLATVGAIALKEPGSIRWGKSSAMIALTAGCGAVVDALINNKFKKGEDNNAIGKKYGPLVGVGAGIIGSIISMGKAVFSKAGLKYMGVMSALCAAVGLGLGAITDHFANKTAKKGAEAAESKTK